MRTRRDVWTLHRDEGLWNQTILAYALAIRVMQDPRVSKPDSWDWAYQAAVHDLPAVTPNDPFTAQCQHATWFFLPWHRMYLLHFESIIRAALNTIEVEAITPATKNGWSLPYWDYEPADNRTLPPAFREEDLPNGLGPNPLAQARRYDWIQSGEVGLADNDVTPVGWWNQAIFATSVAAASFGGQMSGWHHRPGGVQPGELEITPHGQVHGAIGPDMGAFATAPLDPVFWLHHCNIDRIWEVWKAEHPAQAMPSGGEWPTLPFDFRGDDDTHHAEVSAKVVTTADLGYTFENTGPPAITPELATRGGQPMSSQDEVATRSLPPTPIGGATEPVTVQLTPKTFDFALEQDERIATRADRSTPARILLHVRDIRADERPKVTYSVYLVGVNDPNVVAYAGNLPLFGLIESMDDDAEHALEYCLDVTDAVNELRANDEWSWTNAKVRIEPSNPEVAARVDSTPEVRFGSVMFSYQ